MTDRAELLRTWAADVRRLASGRLDHCRNPKVIQRYRDIPSQLADQERCARRAMECAKWLDFEAGRPV